MKRKVNMEIKEFQSLQTLLGNIAKVNNVIKLTGDGTKFSVINEFYDFRMEIPEKLSCLDAYRQVIVAFVSYLTGLKAVKEMEINHIDALVKLLAERSKLNVDNVN